MKATELTEKAIWQEEGKKYLYEAFRVIAFCKQMNVSSSHLIKKSANELFVICFLFPI